MAVLCAVFQTLNIAHMQVSIYSALREGLVYEMMGRHHHQDVRERTMVTRSRQYQVDEAHGRRVQATALGLYRQVGGPRCLGDALYPRILAWAARLHKIGLMVAHSQYHRHGAYLLRNADLAGFTRQEQTILAALVPGHRRKFPTQDFAALPPGIRDCTGCLCVILRITALLHRGRTPNNRPRPVLQVEGDNLSLVEPTRTLTSRATFGRLALARRVLRTPCKQTFETLHTN